jgi:membrane protease subunit HflC
VRRRLFALLAVVAVVGFVRLCVVVIEEREQAFRTLLNDPEPRVMGFLLNRPELTEPGLYVKIPGLHQLYRFDHRRFFNDTATTEIYTKEKLPIEVDYYAIWRIEDTRLFFESVRTESQALRRLDTVTYSELRKTLALYSLVDLLSEQRPVILQQVAKNCDAELRPLGIRVLDLRIRRSDYPEANLAKIFSRMQTERQRFAKKYRAEGEEMAREVRSRADRDSEVIRAEATRKAAKTRGEGDARAAAIFADAYGQDADFYAFVRSLEAYRKALDEETMLILTPQSHFLRYLFPKRGDATPELPDIGAPPSPERAP